GLPYRAGVAARKRRGRVALDLDRPAVADLDQQAAARRTAAAGRRVPARDTGNQPLRLVDQRHRLALRDRSAARERCGTEREAHELRGGAAALATLPVPGRLPERPSVRQLLPAPGEELRVVPQVL